MRPSNRGFTLIEIVVVILVLAILIAMAAALTRGVAAGQRRSLTVTRMQTVDAALVQFVMQQKRLPCPANGALPSTDGSAGSEGPRNAAGCNPTTQQDGVVPWIALGISESDASDGWDRRFTYRVFPALAGDSGMDMSWCDPAGSGPATGVFPNTACNSAIAPNDCNSTVAGLTRCTPPIAFLTNKGLEVRKADGVTKVMDPLAPLYTGAAYVLISHGETGGGGYLNSGTLGTSTLGTDGTEEMRNYASGSYAGVATWYVDDSLSEVNTTAHFDDIVSRPSILAVITKAGLGPRSH